jgi:hypothetical protein
VTRERRRDPDFAKSVVDALEPAVQVIEDALFAADLRGDVRPQVFFLNNRTRNRRWKERWEHPDTIRYDRDEPIPMQAQVTAKGTEKGGVQRPRERLPTPYGRRTPAWPTRGDAYFVGMSRGDDAVGTVTDDAWDNPEFVMPDDAN